MLYMLMRSVILFSVVHERLGSDAENAALVVPVVEDMFILKVFALGAGFVVLESCLHALMYFYTQLDGLPAACAEN